MDCGHEWYRYFSCGNSHCPLCQGNRREAWYERINKRLLAVPYVHITFTLPHELNGLCRLHPGQMYNMLFRSAWQTIRQLCGEAQNVGGLPGMTAVLHTWGSDLKHHVHLHCLVTWGGYNEATGKWHWLKVRGKLLKYRLIRRTFREYLLSKLKSWMKSNRQEQPVYHQSYEVLTADLIAKQWVVNQQAPTARAAVINAYLSRYICRIGISDRRLVYDAAKKEVYLEYKDYRKQQSGQAAPLAYRTLAPLTAMDMILQHVLPPYFRRSRDYGLHFSSTRNRIDASLPDDIKKNPDTVRELIRLLKEMLRLQPSVCEACGSMEAPKEEIVRPDTSYVRQYLEVNLRSPPSDGRAREGVANNKAV